MNAIKNFGKWLNAFNNQAVMWAEPDIAGYLDKRGGSSWKTRFVVLQGSTLFYFASPFKIQNPLGVLPMEGSGLEAAGVEEGGSQRKWCFRIKLGSQFEKAKRSIYVFAAPSKQAQGLDGEQEEWLENLKYAATARADLIGYLNRARKVGADIRFKLSRSPANHQIIQASAKGPEGNLLQAEIARVKKQLLYLSEQTTDIKAQSEKLEMDVMLALASWDFFRQLLAGKRHLDFAEKLENELNLTIELVQLLFNKLSYMQGSGLEILDEDARADLKKICEKFLTKIREHQAKIRIKAPRYTTEVNPHIFPENDKQFNHTSEMFILCSESTARTKLLALQRKVDHLYEEGTRHGKMILVMHNNKVVGTDIAKISIQNIAAEFQKEISSVNKFTDAEVLTVSNYIMKKTTSKSSDKTRNSTESKIKGKATSEHHRRKRSFMRGKMIQGKTIGVNRDSTIEQVEAEDTEDNTTS